MPDRLDDLFASLKEAPMPANALPPDQVRRLGDRQRRRRTVGVTLATVAAVAVVAAGGVAAGLFGGNATAPGPAGSPSNSTVATDFPPAGIDLTVNYPNRNEDGSLVAVDEQAPAPGTLCGESVPLGTQATRAASVSYTGVEDSRSRTLYEYPDAATAEQDQAAFQRQLDGCPQETVGGTDQVYEQLPDEEGVYFHRYRTAGVFDPALEVVSTKQFDRYVLVESQYGEFAAGTRPERIAVAQSMWMDSAPISETLMDLTYQQGSTTSTERPSGPATRIPDDFALDAALPATSGDDQIYGPSRELDAFDLTLCGEHLWPPDAQDRLSLQINRPAGLLARDLVTFTDADAAAAHLERIRVALANCPRVPSEDTPGEPTDRVNQRVDIDLGYDSLTWIGYWDAPIPGADAVSVVRVGNALLLTFETGEGNQQTARADARALATPTKTLAAQMCVFTADGC